MTHSVLFANFLIDAAAALPGAIVRVLLAKSAEKELTALMTFKMKFHALFVALVFAMMAGLIGRQFPETISDRNLILIVIAAGFAGQDGALVLIRRSAPFLDILDKHLEKKEKELSEK